MPNGCDDDALPWARQADNFLDTKYPYVCHAELNAILNKNSASLKGCTMYVCCCYIKLDCRAYTCINLTSYSA